MQESVSSFHFPSGREVQLVISVNLCQILHGLWCGNVSGQEADLCTLDRLPMGWGEAPLTHTRAQLILLSAKMLSDNAITSASVSSSACVYARACLSHYRKAIAGKLGSLSARKAMQLLIALWGLLLGVPRAPSLSLETTEETELGMGLRGRRGRRGG